MERLDSKKKVKRYLFSAAEDAEQQNKEKIDAFLSEVAGLRSETAGKRGQGEI